MRGLYALIFPGGELYVGASFDIESRIERHFKRLRAGTHPNRGVQAAWNKTPGQIRVERCPLQVETVEQLCAYELKAIQAVVVELGRAMVLNRSLSSSPNSFSAFAKKQKQSFPSPLYPEVEAKGNGQSPAPKQSSNVDGA